jgi:hypothetical protein
VAKDWHALERLAGYSELRVAHVNGDAELQVTTRVARGKQYSQRRLHMVVVAKATCLCSGCNFQITDLLPSKKGCLEL